MTRIESTVEHYKEYYPEAYLGDNRFLLSAIDKVNHRKITTLRQKYRIDNGVIYIGEPRNCFDTRIHYEEYFKDYIHNGRLDKSVVIDKLGKKAWNHLVGHYEHTKTEIILVRKHTSKSESTEVIEKDPDYLNLKQFPVSTIESVICMINGNQSRIKLN